MEYRGAGFLILGVVVAAGIAPLRRVLALLFLAFGVLLLLWALYDKRTGLGDQSLPFAHLLWGPELTMEFLLVAAPAVAIAGLIGRRQPGPKRIWLSGLFGITLPMVFSFAAATAAHAAGLVLTARPKPTFWGFVLALQVPPGLEDWVRSAIYLSYLCPALIAAIVIQEFLPPGRRLLHTLWPSALATLLGYIGSPSHWEGNADRAWALSLLLLGLVSPIAYFAWRRKYRT